MSEIPAKIRKNITFTESCWEWNGYTGYDGYGRSTWKGTTHVAHRILYQILVGKIKKGLTLDHLCRNRKCVNPSHLEPVTRGENVLRGETIPAANLKKTHCPLGHPYEGENLVLERNRSRPNRARKCRKCKNRRRREWSVRNPGYWIKYQNKRGDN